MCVPADTPSGLQWSMKKLILGVTALMLTACAPSVSANLQPSLLEQAPTLDVKVTLNPNMPSRQTFAVIPYTQISDKAQATGITAQHLAFQVRNNMELLGYRYVERPDEADLQVLVDASNPYNTSYVPPSQYTVPVYVPGKSSTYSTYSSGSFSSGSTWGTYTGTGTGTVTVPGYYTSRTYTTSGYTQGYFYPGVTAVIVDRQTQAIQATASGVGTSRNPDLRVSMQNLLYDVFGKMPVAQKPAVPAKSGRMGLSYASWTADGNTYYPLVTGVTKDGPAARAGLAVGDFILSVDGTATINLPVSQIDQLIAADAGTQRTLVINRGTSTKSVQFVMTSP